jgi:hypothetical protein
MLAIKNQSGNYRNLSQVFSPSLFRKVVKEQDFDFIAYRLKKNLMNLNSNNYASLLEFVYKSLAKNYQSEYIYKNTLLNKLLLGKYSLNTATALNEFKINNSIADFILLNGEARIYEIKTDLDNFSKLEKQISDYRKFAEKVYIVVSPKNSTKILELYEGTSIGVLEFTKRLTLKEIKKAEVDKTEFNHETIFKLLRKKEYLNIIYDYFGKIPNVPNTLLFRESLKLIKQININHFQSLVINKLKERKIKCPELLISDSIPSEIKHICYTLNFTKNEYLNLKNFLSTKL